MPKKKNYNAEPLTPPEFAYPRTTGGGVEKVQIFKDILSGHLLLQCPTCDRYLSYNNQNEKPYITHRGGVQCIQGAKAKFRQSIKQEAEVALKESGLDHSLADSSSCRSNVPVI
jgi:hypothetical protein